MFQEHIWKMGASTENSFPSHSQHRYNVLHPSANAFGSELRGTRNKVLHRCSNTLLSEPSVSAVFTAYRHFRTYFSFHFVGIFVIMFIQVATTLLRSATLLSTLYVAFAVTFHKLLTLPEEAVIRPQLFCSQCFQEFEEATREHKNRLAYCFLGFEHLNQSADVLGSRAQMGLPIKVYDSIGWALFQTLMMMVGEYDHTQLIVEPYLDGMSATIYIPELTFPFFAAFVFLVPITLVNLLVSLTGFVEAC
ncbi:uncharacterized protein DEA37_0003328 [Paragonimus westermani]|uniref:Ion transport domain-containing protein n=1 Tax=Paragonimus westermani TaxID=34504 RepID=A0A5J4NSF5_9TREM|nr:uncharacterized protein DEA37_0003328 [Paragonimus westermani]